MNGGVDDASGNGRGHQGATATRSLYIKEGDLLAVTRPMRARRVSFKIGELLIVKAGGSYRPELLLVLLPDRRKDSESLGIGRPGGI